MTTGATFLCRQVERDVANIEKLHEIRLSIEDRVYSYYESSGGVIAFRKAIRDVLLLPLVRREIRPGDRIRIYLDEHWLTMAWCKLHPEPPTPTPPPPPPPSLVARLGTFIFRIARCFAMC